MKNLILILVLLISTITNAQWVNIRPQLNGKFYQMNGITYMMGGTSSEAYIYSTTNDGTSWTTLSGVILNGGTLNCFVMKDLNTILIGTSTGVKYKNGTLYTQSSLTNNTKSIIYDGTNFWAGTPNGLYKSTNNGMNWTLFTYGIINGANITYLFKAEANLFALSSGLFKSTNNGLSWDYDGDVNGVCMSYSNGTLWLAGNIVRRSINFGVNWTSYDVLGSPNSATSIASNGTDVYISTGGLGCNVFHGYLQGSTYSFALRNSGLPYSLSTKDMVVGYNNILLSSDNAIWRSTLSYLTKIKSEVTPVNFALKQNYPNPFNPSTTIRYQVPKQEVITLKIYDIGGKEIETLVSEKQSPGTYEVTWNASKYTSGAYFYKIETESFTDTKRMLLIK